MEGSLYEKKKVLVISAIASARFIHGSCCMWERRWRYRGKKEKITEIKGQKQKQKQKQTQKVAETLVFGRGGDSVSLDPSRVTDGESFKVTENLFETLLNFGEQDTTINPGLAKDWEVSDDGLTYTFELQKVLNSMMVLILMQKQL